MVIKIKMTVTINEDEDEDFKPASGIDKEVCEFANYIGEGH